MDLRIALWRPARNPLQTSNPGRIFENMIIISLPAQGAGYESTPADVQAYDVRTGKILWVFHSIPHPGEFGYDTWPEGAFRTAGGVHNWSELTVDEQRGIAFIPFGTARFDFYGGNRQGANLFGNSLVALDARTGKRLWHHQLVHHDLWDFDLPQAPKLLTLRQNGRNVDVVAQATKHGLHLRVRSRDRHSPFFPIEERPVPQTDVPGEVTWPTQPFPTKPAPFARQSFTEKDINPFLPQAEKERSARAAAQLAQRGPVHAAEPPGLGLDARSQRRRQLGQRRRGSGARRVLRRVEEHAGDAASRAQQRRADRGRRAGRWPGAADHHARSRRRSSSPRRRRRAAKGPIRYTSPYDFMLSPTNGMTAIGPPWSQITAYDLNTGDIKWRVPHGGVMAPPGSGHPGRCRVAHAARRSARHGRRAGVRGHGVRSHGPRLRPRLGQGGVDAPICRRAPRACRPRTR